MDESFIEETKQEFVGYTMFGENLLKVVDDTKTVNELLHAFHSYITNNEGISRKLFDFIGSVPMDYDIVYDWDEVTSTIPKEPVVEEEQATFSESQAKDLTLERRTSGIKRIQEILQRAKNFILGKFTKEKGDTDNDKSIGDK